eukprot:Filipodium_phascolosomae@DN1968_c0_g1_i1.p1
MGVIAYHMLENMRDALDAIDNARASDGLYDTSNIDAQQTQPRETLRIPPGQTYEDTFSARASPPSRRNWAPPFRPFQGTSYMVGASNVRASPARNTGRHAENEDFPN